MTDEVVIPAGMKPWNGGDAAPADWDGGKILLRNGSWGVPPTTNWRNTVYHRDIIAYTPMTPEPAQPAETPEARARASYARLLVSQMLHGDAKAITRAKVDDDDRVFIDGDDVEALVERLLAASTARPTERGAVEWWKPAVQWLRERADQRPPDSLWSAAATLADRLEKQATDPQQRLPPATDQAAEVEAGERVADAVHAELWKADDENKRLREAVAKAHLFAVITLAFLGRDRGTDRQDGMLDDLQREAASTETILRATLATQPATGRTMGGEVENDPLDLGGHLGHEAVALCPSDRERMRTEFAALQNGDE